MISVLMCSVALILISIEASVSVSGFKFTVKNEEQSSKKMNK